MFSNDVVNILLVDDQPAKLLSYETILSDLGENLIRASSGREALQQLLKHEIAVVLVDVCMPDLDGFELATAIRQHPRFQRTAIILVSAVRMTDLDRLKGYDCGAVDYVSVPVIPDILRAKVAIFADLYRKNQELQRLNHELELRVSERTAALELSTMQLRENEERLKLAVEGSGMGTWDEDLQTGKAFWSFTHFTMLGYPATPSGEASREMMLNRVHTDDLERVVGQIEHAKRQKELYSSEHRVLRADNGEMLWLSAFGRFLYDGSGRALRFVGVLFDITRRKQAELERTDLLAREQAARKAAEEANRIKDEFLATLSHELRTPLNVIFGWTRLLRTGKLDSPTSTQALEVIERNAQLQNQLIAELLDVSRIVSGKLRLEVQSIDLIKLIQEAVDSIGPAVAAKSIDLQLRLEPDVGLICGDPNRLQQVVWNLLSNAVKFSPQLSSVEVSLKGADSTVEIVVSDTGEGIDPNFLPHIFDRFSQADSSTARRHGGLGLGLAIVRHLVELHGGTVAAQSPGVGRGSTFTVRLPRRAVQEHFAAEALLRKQNRIELAGSSLEPFESLGSIRVLAVDDDRDACDLLSVVLRKSGAEVRIALSAKEALAVMQQWRPDVLVADIGMPEGDGYSLIRRIRALTPEQGGTIPALALSAYVQSQDRMRALNEGFQIHLTKPLEAGELLRSIRSLTR